MPRRYLTPGEARDLRIMGQGEQIQRDENDEDFMVLDVNKDDIVESIKAKFA